MKSNVDVAGVEKSTLVNPSSSAVEPVDLAVTLTSSGRPVAASTANTTSEIVESGVFGVSTNW